MNNVDDILNLLKTQGIDTLDSNIPNRDKKILKNIANLISSQTYITENQGKLLVKILKENFNYIIHLDQKIKDILDNPSWSKDFRRIIRIREVSVSTELKGVSSIKVNFSFDKETKKIVEKLNKLINSDLHFIHEKSYHYTYTEKNIITIYELLQPSNFTFSEDFIEIYEKIKSINLDEAKQKLSFENFYHTVSGSITDTLFKNIDNDPLLILDRKIRYQYEFNHNFDPRLTESLCYKIASRQNNKIFINDLKVNFNHLVDSLNTLKREKILVIFDEYKITDCIKILELLKKSFDKNHVGIYFRFDNKNEGTTFNQLITKFEYNKKLDANTQLVGLSNGKLPKFVLKSNWYPDAVISFTNSFRNNRTDLYCSNCDLIIYYTELKPLIAKCDEIL
jgi:hypothetical protein